MTGTCNLMLIYSRDDKNNRWLTRRDNIYEGQREYRNLVRIDHFDEPGCSPSEIRSLFTDENNRHLGVLDTDVPTKLDIEGYITVSNILRKRKYKFNKKTQKLIIDK